MEPRKPIVWIWCFLDFKQVSLLQAVMHILSPNYCFLPTILLLKHQNIWLTLQKFFTCRILSIWTMSKNITIFFSSRFFIILLIPYCSSSSCMWRHLLAEIWWWAERPRHIKGCLHYRFSFSYFFSYFSFLFFLSFE